jgi:hypothetical protein
MSRRHLHLRTLHSSRVTDARANANANEACDSGRRRTLARLLALAGAASTAIFPLCTLAQTAALRAAGSRRALVIGNTAYAPERQAIPSSRKNATDVGAALEKLGFEVTREVDQGTQAMRALLQKFLAAARADTSGPSLAILYYTGHGIQYQGENYIVPSDVNLNQGADAIARACINIDRELLAQTALPNDGTAALIFDACRNDPTRSPADRSGSFNQVNPPRGTIITYSTAPGRYAITPRSPDENSIYTAVLVDELTKANPAISIKDFLDAVKFRVKRSMETSDEPFLRKNAQDPEVAANLPLRMSLALAKPPPAADDEEDKAWAIIDQTLAPGERLALLKAFIEKFRDSRFLQAAQVQLERAVLSEAATQRNRVQIETGIGDAEFRSDQAKALDGDKDAAFRIARMFEQGTNGVPRDERRMVQWLRHASELKNGIAAYQLYVYYRDRQLDRDAVRFENLAREHGYTPPPRLDTRR